MCETGYKSSGSTTNNARSSVGGSGALGTVNVRGYLGLRALTVWVQPGVSYDVRCEEWSCSEAERVPACFPVTSVLVGDDGGEEAEGGKEEESGVWEGE